MIRGMYRSCVWILAFAGMMMMALVGCALEASEPSTSPTPVPESVSTPTPDSLDLLVLVLREARALGVLSDELADLLSDLFIEYLIAPATGETPDAARRRLSADWGTMTITNPDGSEITTMEQWSERVNSSHWKPGRSAYSLADFVMNRGGGAVLRERVSSVSSQPVTLDTGTPEYGAKFDSHGGSPSKLDLGIFGRVEGESSLFVGLEAKVDEPFGSDTVCKRYQRAVNYLEENPRSKAADRVRDLLSHYFGETADPCDSTFSDIRYQLLTSTAGTVAVGADIPVFYVMVFKTDLYDEGKGRENRLDYERFIEAAGGRVIVQGEDGFDAHEIIVAGKRLICIYDYFGEWD